MEIVVFNSDIARLVLGYLKSQHLEKASRIFCKTSPHLHEEYTAYKQGFQAHSFFPELEEIIREYVKITRKVDEVVESLSEVLRAKFQHKKLSDKCNDLLELLVPVEELNEEHSTKSKSNQNETNSDESSKKENLDENSVRKCNQRKRKRSLELSANPLNERSDSFSTNVLKKRRRTEPFCYLNSEQSINSIMKKKNKTQRSNLVECSRETNEIIDSESDSIATDDGKEDEEEIEVEDNIDTVNGTNGRTVNKPIKESTPRKETTSMKIVTPSSLDFSQVILDNPEFQEILAQNINHALQLSETSKSAIDDTENEKRKNEGGKPLEKEKKSGPAMLGNVESSGQLLDQLVKEILENTEKDPVFDAIIEEVVDVCSNNSQTSTGVQCNIEANSKRFHQIASSSASIGSSGDAMLSSANSITPGTPLLIRTIVASNTPCNNNNNNSQVFSSVVANSSFGSLIDPNFSISKLLVLNSCESAQKQLPESTTINLSNDNVLIPLAAATTSEATINDATTIADQIYLDPSSGQLSCQLPLFLTSDGILTNLPYLINNELSVNERGMEPSEELPFVSATSARSVGNSSHQTIHQLTEIKTNREVSLAMPSSLDSRLNLERVTPSTGIINTKAFRSFSTPRKRASHIRALTFSPRCCAVGSTPLSRRETGGKYDRLKNKDVTRTNDDITKTAAKSQQSADIEQPATNTIQILSDLPNTVKSRNVDMENSNSSSAVPPLFANEESSNQTVINTSTTKEVNQHVSTETPKRRQLRKSAVQACKRMLSRKAAQEEIVTEEADNNSKIVEKQQNCEEQQKEMKDANQVKIPNDQMMKEWVRMRTASANDLDFRLREWNRKMMQGKPHTKRVLKVRKKRRKIQTTIVNKAGEGVKKINLKRANREVAKIDKVEQKTRARSKRHSEQIEVNETVIEDAETSLEVKDTSISSKNSPIEQLKRSENHFDAKECEKRTSNIAVLLETPFKENIRSPVVPPTPGGSAATSDTPLDSTLPSASSLFGSLTKSELETPVLSAITPGGFRFTPFGSKDATPRSGATTEYSSGGSYYKPDESEDLDHNFDNLLRNSEGKSSSTKLAEMTEGVPKVSTELPIKSSSEIDEEQIVEIPAEMLKVEPIVLKRVKSFGNEVVENEGNLTNIEPHYTLVTGLPENINDEITSSSSSSSSSPSSSSSSSSSRTFSSTSSKNSRKPAEICTDLNGTHTIESASVLDDAGTSCLKAKQSAELSIDNLSDISSAEDEEWEKEAISEDEHSRLVGNDGEVRYPVRSWLTPKKNDNDAIDSNQQKPNAIKVKLSLNSVEKRGHLRDLEEKRLRIKEKLRIDEGRQIKSDVNEKKKKNELAPPPRQSQLPKGSKSNKTLKTQKVKKEDEVNEKEIKSCTIEVLAALNLSAKKQEQQHNRGAKGEANTEKRLPPVNDLDDNAIFETMPEKKNEKKNEKFEISVPKPSERTKPLKLVRLPTAELVQSIRSKATANIHRRCVQIEPQSLSKPKAGMRTRRSNATTITETRKSSTSSTKTPAISAAPKSGPIPKIQIKSYDNLSLKKPRAPLKSKEPKVEENDRVKIKLIEVKSQTPEKNSTKRTKKSPGRKTIAKESNEKPRKADNSKKDDRKQLAFETESKEKIEIPQNIHIPANQINSPILISPTNAKTQNKVENERLLNEDNDVASVGNDSVEDGCVLTSCEENERNFITMKYKGHDIKEQNLLIPKKNINDYRMVIGIDEDEQFLLQVSEEIYLFESEPKERTASAIVQDTPKKLKVRISSPRKSNDSDILTSSKSQKAPVNTSKDNSNNKESIKECSNALEVEKTIKRKSKLSSSPQTESSFTEAYAIEKGSGVVETQKIKIGDIDSILSHLHDT